MARLQRNIGPSEALIYSVYPLLSRFHYPAFNRITRFKLILTFTKLTLGLDQIWLFNTQGIQQRVISCKFIISRFQIV